MRGPEGGERREEKEEWRGAVFEKRLSCSGWCGVLLKEEDQRGRRANWGPFSMSLLRRDGGVCWKGGESSRCCARMREDS